MIIPFAPWHADELREKLQPGQEGTEISPNHVETFTRGLCAWTCVDADFNAVASAGILPIWPGRALAWALLSKDVGPHMREVTKATIEALDACPCDRVELYAVPGFHAAFRWARMLGFEFEAMLEGANPRGGDMAIFKRIKGKAHGRNSHFHGHLFSGGNRLQRASGDAELASA
jgi:hypothetical protein